MSLVVSVAVAVPAQAQIVYDHGNNQTITVANDDGSNPQPLLYAYQLKGVKGIFAPAVNPGGSTVVFQADASIFDARAAAACGDNCQEVYKYENGTISPVSDIMPGPCSEPCARLEQQPEIGANGKVVAEYEWETWSSFYDPYTGYMGYVPDPDSWATLTVSPHGSPYDSASSNDIATQCTGHSLTDRPQMPGISPDGTRVAYVDCTDPNNSSKYMTAVENLDGSNSYVCGEDDALMQDPSFSLDASRIIDGEAGDNPGLWSYGSNCNSTGQTPNPTYVIAAPASWTFYSPRFAGNGRIYFDAQHQIDSNTNKGDVYSIPASCTSATCTFPGSATQITNTGDVVNVSWTAKTLTPNTSNTNTGGNGSGGTGGTTINGPTPQPSPDPLPGPVPNPTAIKTALSAHLAKLSKGITVTLTCPVACTGTVTLTLPAAVAKRLHMSKVFTLGRATFKGSAGKTTHVKVKVNRRTQQRLRKLRSLSVTLTVKSNQGASIVRHLVIKH